MQPGDLVKVNLSITPKDWGEEKMMFGVLIRRWSDELQIPEFDFFGDIEEDIMIEIEEPYWEVKLSNGNKDFFREVELERIA